MLRNHGQIAAAILAWWGFLPLHGQDSQSLTAGQSHATITLQQGGDLRTYRLNTDASLREKIPPDRIFSETAAHPRIRTGSLLFDGLYAMAVDDAQQNSVSQISDGAYGHGTPIRLDAFQTGQFWTYVWTRDLSYSLYLALAGFDPRRAVNSLLFKASSIKDSAHGGFRNQIVQDTGSGGSYPVSTDRVVWALGAFATLEYLRPAEQSAFLAKVYPILCDTIEQDRKLVFDPRDGLYRGEQSFLDWREQTYPAWTKDDVLPIAMSKSLSVNAADYFLLETASAYSRLSHQAGLETKYAAWANDLKAAINRGFFDQNSGLYSTYLLSDGAGHAVRASRYDLLGESLAVLFGIANEDRAQSVIRNYPVGPFGPPVVWPEEKSVPIYHNEAIWPFVTAYWIKAARRADNFTAVDDGIQSMEQLSALNLSNMENYDFDTGRSHVDDGPRKGPVIDSRRQLWSVAGYLSMVQDVVFGLTTSLDGIRFDPYITGKLRNDTFGSADSIELQGYPYRGTQNEVRLHLPPRNSFTNGICQLDRVELNGHPATQDFIRLDALQPSNTWDIYLKAPPPEADPPAVHMVNVSDESAVFGPPQPQWEENAITVEGGRLVLNYRDDGGSNVAFHIFRDGRLCAQNIRQTKWVDPLSSDYGDVVHTYMVEAVDPRSGNVSHLTPGRSYRSGDQEQSIPASTMQNHGGNLVGNHHFENWGKLDDRLLTPGFKVTRPGRYQIRVQFANGAGPVNTGITCAVKKLEIRAADGGEIAATGYAIMPQSGDWNRWDLSTPVEATLSPGKDYTICLSEDEISRNMSYLRNNERYTAGNGGGDQGYNYVNVASIQVLYMAPE